MGYAGYSPGNNSRQADELTPLQKALRSLPLARWQDILKYIEDLTKNIIRQPHEDHLREIKFSDVDVATAVAEAPAALDILKEMGWVVSSGGLVLPEGVLLTHQRDIIGIIEARDYYKKEAENERKRQMRARKSAVAAREAASSVPRPASAKKPTAPAGSAAESSPVPSAASSQPPAYAGGACLHQKAQNSPAAGKELSESKLRELTVKQLRELLSEHGISAADCIEKADMVAKLRSRIPAAPKVNEEQQPHAPSAKPSQEASSTPAIAPAVPLPAASGSSSTQAEAQRLRGEVQQLRKRLAAEVQARREAEQRAATALYAAEAARGEATEAQAAVAIREKEEAELAAAIAMSLERWAPEARQDSPRPAPPEPFRYVEAEESTRCWL